MIVNLQRMLDGLDPTRGDRVDSAELEVSVNMSSLISRHS